MRLILSTLLCLSLIFQSLVVAQASQMACEGSGAVGSHTGQVLSANDSCCVASVTDPGSVECQSEMVCHAFACVLADSFLMPVALPISSMQPSIDEGLRSRDLTEVWRPPTSV